MNVLDLCNGSEIVVKLLLRGREVEARVLSDYEQQRIINVCPRPSVRREDPDMVRDAAERQWRADCVALCCAASLRLSTSVTGAYAPSMTPGELETWAAAVLRIDNLRAKLSGPEIDGVHTAWQSAAAVRRVEAADETKKD